MAEKRQRDEGREMAGSPSFLSSPGGGNTGTGKHTFPGKLCLPAAAADANLTHLRTRVRDMLETPG